MTSTPATAEESLLPVLVSAAGTDAGPTRTVNEDSFASFEADSFRLFLVADGMGGPKRGGVASNAALTSIQKTIEGKKELSAHFIQEAVKKANQEVFRRAAEEVSLFGMGSTVTALGFLDNRLLVCHVGNSRAYRIRGGTTLQMTTDHLSFRSEASSTAKSIDLGTLNRWLGASEDVEVDCFFTRDRPQTDDIYLLTTDGLHDYLEGYEIAEAFATVSLEEGIKRLIGLAREKGTKDNLTIIAVKVEKIGGDKRAIDDVFKIRTAPPTASVIPATAAQKLEAPPEAVSVEEAPKEALVAQPERRELPAPSPKLLARGPSTSYLPAPKSSMPMYTTVSIAIATGLLLGGILSTRVGSGAKDQNRVAAVAAARPLPLEKRRSPDISEAKASLNLEEDKNVKEINELLKAAAAEPKQQSAYDQLAAPLSTRLSPRKKPSDPALQLMFAEVYAAIHDVVRGAKQEMQSIKQEHERQENDLQILSEKVEELKAESASHPSPSEEPASP